MTTNQTNQPTGRVCAHQDCQTLTSRNDHFLCLTHFREAERGLISKCSRCATYKPARLPLCSLCFVNGSKSSPNTSARPIPPVGRSDYTPESSPAWEAGDANAAQFYVYILRLDGGGFYIGHTRELLERLSEHRDGRVLSTKGQSPALAWFTELSSREAATKLEAELKQVRDRDERAIRRMIIRFQILVRELDRD